MPEFAVQCLTTGEYATQDGSAILPSWSTRTDWGDVVRFAGLSPGEHTFCVYARNGDGVETDPSPASDPVALVEGDVDGDTCVNVMDLLAVRANLGKEGSGINPPGADIDSDGKVNVIDLLGVRANLGKGSGCP